MANNFFGLTDTGRVRGNNEDAFIVQLSADGEYILAAAIDGVGGYSGGEIAAALARETIIDQLAKPGGNIISMMAEALLKANEKIYQEKIEVREHESMACVLTLAVVDVKNNEFHYIHVGDTRLYLLRDGSLIKVTKDQSFVGYLEDSGRLTEEAAMSHPKRNEINKALGFNTGLENDIDYFETGSSPFLPGDMILLCSDGLTDLVPRKDITQILSSDSGIEVMAQELIDDANSKGGKDNITVVLVKNDRPVQQQAVNPVPASKKKVLTPAVPKRDQDDEPDVVSEDAKSEAGKNGTPLSIWLIILCAALSLVIIYILFLHPKTQISVPEKVVIADTAESSSEQLFYQALNSGTSDTLVLNDSSFRQPIILTRSININRDTLYILARGKIAFQPDSVFAGPAFRIPASAKNIVLNGMIIDGFEVGIESQTKNLKLIGIQFLDCPVPVRYQFGNTPDRFMNGSLKEIFLKADSLQTIQP
ncbi:protein phosphatase 2C domain-containing protein [Daejeonella sp. JGW-45]|uniref:PP2C family protein-serine/threonine phosphatase n=1 Tax=Daejeonella sp. JGW-45 TaxID=3034148 RepID=UPI0023EAAE11|nr:protein phosphatase 2C domain-containing protein [Daejeonella sp. JGW-45]